MHQNLARASKMLRNAAREPNKEHRNMNEKQEPKYEIKDGRLFSRSSKLPIPEDEPIFVFRGRDVHTRKVLEFYIRLLKEGSHKEAVKRRHWDMRKFAHDFPDRMKEPETKTKGGVETVGLEVGSLVNIPNNSGAYYTGVVLGFVTDFEGYEVNRVNAIVGVGKEPHRQFIEVNPLSLKHTGFSDHDAACLCREAYLAAFGPKLLW